MDEEKRTKKKKKNYGTHSEKRKKVLQISSNTEIEETAAVKQAKSSMMISASDKSQWNLMFFSPNENNINSAEKLTWNIGPFRDAEFKFHKIHPLVILWKFMITVQEFDNNTGKPKVGASELKIALKPEAHGCYPHLIKLDQDRFPLLTYFIDQQNLGLGFVLMFRRELDVERNSTQPHPFSSQTCFRPASLNRITVLEGGDQGGNPIIFNNMDINNMAYNKLDPSMRKFADNAVRQGWISLKQARRYWETPYFQGTAMGSPAGGDVGVNNYFPVSLLDSSVRKNFSYFSSNGLKSNNLSIKLEFTEALTKQWYMMIISEYLVAITFDPKTGNPSFNIV